MATRPPSSPWRRWSAKLAVAAVAVSSLWVGSAQAQSAGDYFVHSLPGAPPGPLLKMHAGHVEITPEHNGNIFFWHFQNKHIANRQRTVIWINGGPGCSSEDGAMMELGPYRMKDENTLEYNDGAWNEFANVLFVDNPVGTGFSYVDTDSFVHELDEMADQFIKFLEKWFALFPEYEHDDLYIAGESFAGQHLPYIAKYILARNKLPDTKYQWQLKGMLIGNGWISPSDQYEAYLDYAYERGLVDKNSDIGQKLEAQRRTCLNELAVNDNAQRVSSAVCENILQLILQLTNRNKGDDQDCINMYDVRLRDSFPSCGMNWPPDLKYLTPYLRRKDVIEALHVNPNKNTGWSECNGNVGSQFRDKESKASITFLPEIIAEVPTVLFSGAEDLICNHLGTESLISNMEWNGGKGFEVSPGNWAPRREWTFEQETIGFWQEARNLTYVLFYNSSHMVPFDYARRSRDMLDRFMGVDISSIGGTPADSRLDGEKGKETTVGGSTGNSSSSDPADIPPEHKAKLDEAKWQAYRKSGEIVLVIVAVSATLWGWYVWRERRKASRAGYRGVSGASLSDTRLPMSNGGSNGGSRLDSFRAKRAGSSRDLEAGDFDENELDDMAPRRMSMAEEQQYSVGGESDDEEDEDDDDDDDDDDEEEEEEDSNDEEEVPPRS